MSLEHVARFRLAARGCCLLLLALGASPVEAEHAQAEKSQCSSFIEEAAQPRESWLQLLGAEGIRIVPARIRRVASGFVLEPAGEVALKDEGLVSGIVINQAGELKASAWHACGQAPSALLGQLAQARDLEAELEQQRVAANLQLRKAAGLAEVDMIYEKAHALAAKTEALDAMLAKLRAIEEQGGQAENAALTPKDS